MVLMAITTDEFRILLGNAVRDVRRYRHNTMLSKFMFDRPSTFQSKNMQMKKRN